MILYKDILGMLKEAGYSTYRIKKEGLLSQATLTKIRANDPISIKSIDAICGLLDCQPGDILEYVSKDKVEE